MGSSADRVALVQAGLERLAEQRGDTLLQLEEGRDLGVHCVADIGLGHGPAQPGAGKMPSACPSLR